MGKDKWKPIRLYIDIGSPRTAFVLPLVFITGPREIKINVFGQAYSDSNNSYWQHRIEHINSGIDIYGDISFYHIMAESL